MPTRYSLKNNIIILLPESVRRLLEGSDLYSRLVILVIMVGNKLPDQYPPKWQNALTR
jgi:hypothetical protein